MVTLVVVVVVVVVPDTHRSYMMSEIRTESVGIKLRWKNRCCNERDGVVKG